MSSTETETVCDTFMSKRGRTKLLVRGYSVVKNRSRDNQFYWKCNLKRSKNCPGRAVTTLADGRHYLKKFVEHNHAPDFPEESNINPETSQLTVQNIVGRMKRKWNNLMTVYRREMTKVIFIESTMGYSSFGSPDTVLLMPSFRNFQHMLLSENSWNQASCANNDITTAADSQHNETSYDTTSNGTSLFLSYASEGADGIESHPSSMDNPSSTGTSEVKVEYNEDEDDDDDEEVLSEDGHLITLDRPVRTGQISDSLNCFTSFVESMLRDMPIQKRKKTMLSISQVLFNDDHDE